MQCDQKKKWEELFGSMWSLIMKNSPEMGGFMLDHKNRSVIMDDNALKLAETDVVPDYDTMTDYLDILKNDSRKFATLAPMVFYDGDDYTAGILRWHYDFSGEQAKSVVPIVEKPQLASAIMQAGDKSVLALVEFCMSDKRSLNDAQVFGALAMINEELPDGISVCANYPMCYWVFIPTYEGDAVELFSRIKKLIEESGQSAKLGGVEEHYITMTVGIGENGGRPERRMSTAEFALYEANLAGKGTILNYSSEQFEANKTEYEKMSRFLKLINENLFIYHFQPIVSAKDGEIIAYEMLMRSEPEIGMNPLEILDCAASTDRLYDIEKATMRNALDFIDKNQGRFTKKRLFVNSITSYMLTDADWQELVDHYGELMQKMVIEFTEQTEITDSTVDEIHRRLADSNIKIAIDDYGTGYSNTSNLIKYSPDVVKIDRSLITGINTKPTLRKLVSGIIEFIHENGYQALAEGVETFEELKTMIQLGVDLIQGFYVSKPRPVLLDEVADSVSREIKSMLLYTTSAVTRPYHPKDGEELDLDACVAEGYNALFVEGESLTIKGRKDIEYDVNIIIKPGISTRIELDGVCFKTDKESPVISVSDGAALELCCTGDCTLDGRGVYVPAMSSIRITGSGNLNVVSNNDDCYGIGAGRDNSHGEIVVDMTGELNVQANGDTVSGIGGGKNNSSRPIQLLGGTVKVGASGGSCIGIGSADGNAIVDIHNTIVSININSPDNVGVGSFKGNTDLEFKNFTLDLELAGISIAGIGSVEGGLGKAILRNGIINATIKGRTVNFIGTRRGALNCHLVKNFITFYSESGSVSAIGDMFGEGDVILDQNHLKFDMRTGEGLAYGSRSGKVEVIDEDPNDEIKINA